MRLRPCLLAALALIGTGALSAGRGEARAVVEAAREVPPFVAPGPAFDARVARGKRVVYASGDRSDPSQRAWAEGLRRVLGRHGVQVVVVDLKGGRSEAVVAAQRVIRRVRPALLVTVGSTFTHNEFLGSALPHGTSPGLLQFWTRSDRAPLRTMVQAQGGFDLLGLGQRIAAAALTLAPDSSAVQTYFVTDESPLRRLVEPAVLEGLSQLTPNPSGTLLRELPPEGWAGDLDRGLEQLAAQRRQRTQEPPGAGAIITLGASVTDEAIRQVSRTPLPGISLVVFPATPAALRALRRHSQVAAVVGFSNRWFAYAMADQALRTLAGLPHGRELKVPFRLFDRSNIQGLDPSGDPERWYGAAYVRGFERLWSGPRIRPEEPARPPPPPIYDFEDDPFASPKLPPNAPRCPGAYATATGQCGEDGTKYLRCAYPEGSCSCSGPPRCSGATPRPLPLSAFAWHCTPRPPPIRPDGCPGRQPRMGTICHGKRQCAYSPTGCGGVVLSCEHGHWQVKRSIAPPP